MVAELTPELLTSQTPPKESDEQPAPTRGARLRAAPALQFFLAGFSLGFSLAVVLTETLP